MSQEKAKSKKPKNQLPRFWVTCYKCETSFGISPGVVFKYVSRALDEVEQDLKRRGKELQAKKTQKAK